MAGTQTTVIVSGVDDFQIKEAITDGTIEPGDLVRLKPGSIATVEQVPAGGTPAGFNVARESNVVEIDGSYTSSEIVQYVVCEPGDEVYANAQSGTAATGSVVQGNLLAGPSNDEDAGALGIMASGGIGTLAMAQENIDPTGSKEQIKVTVV